MNRLDTFTLKTLEVSVKRRIHEKGKEEQARLLSEFIEQITEARKECEELFKDKSDKIYKEFMNKAESELVQSANDILISIADDIHTYVETEMTTGDTHVMLRIG